MCEAVTLFAPVVVTLQVSVFLSADRVKFPVPTAGVVTAVGRSFAPFSVAVKVSGPGPLLSPLSQATAIATASTGATNHFDCFMRPPLKVEKPDIYSICTEPSMNGCGTQWYSNAVPAAPSKVLTNAAPGGMDGESHTAASDVDVCDSDPLGPQL